MLSVFRTSVLRWLIITAMLSLLGGCTALRIGYSTAPDLVYWWLDRYVDFNGGQTVRVRGAIRQWFAWHRHTQVPEYGAQLDRARTEVLADTTPARVCEWQAVLVQDAHTAFDRIAPDAADLMLTITPEQVRHLEQRYARNNADFRDNYLQPDLVKRAEATNKRVVDRAETLYGDLDDKQRDAIAQALTHSPFDPQRWFEERQKRQEELLQGLRRLGGAGVPREQAQAALAAYVAHLERSPREAYQQYSERLASFNCGFVARLHNATTAAQRRHAADAIAGWAGDLQAIARTEATPPRQQGDP